MGINVANAPTDASSSLVVTSNGGESWSSPDLASVTNPLAVAFGLPDDCVVLGDSGAAYTPMEGRPGSRSSAPPPVSNPQAASCPAPSVRVFVGGQGNGLGAAFSTDGGNSWTAGSLTASSSLSKTIRTHKDGIMASIELGISNGRAEGVEYKGLFHYRQMLWASFRRGDTDTGDAFLWTDLFQSSV